MNWHSPMDIITDLTEPLRSPFAMRLYELFRTCNANSSDELPVPVNWFCPGPLTMDLLHAIEQKNKKNMKCGTK